MITIGILAGGKSTRFETDKACALYKGTTFLEHLIQKFYHYAPVLVCANKDYPITRAEVIKDIVPSNGPIAGVITILSHTKTQWTFMIAVDMPLVDIDILDRLVSQIDENPYADVIAFKTDHLEPLCALYNKSALDKIMKFNQSGVYALQKVLSGLHIMEVKLDKTMYHKVSNINTQLDYQKLKPFVFTICGSKNSGKTSFIKRISEIIRDKGYSVCYIKHDGHTFSLDDCDTDTERVRRAGVENTIVLDHEKMNLISYTLKLEDVLTLYQYCDFIILEGFKHSNYRKFELIRKANSPNSVLSNEKADGLITDMDIPHPCRFNLSDYSGFVDYIIKMKGQTID